MIKKMVAFLGCLILGFLLMGCNGQEMKVNNKQSQEDIEQEIIQYIKDNYNDTVTIELIDKETLSVPTAWVDGPMLYENVDGAHSYEFEVTPSQYPDLHIRVNYNDSYILTEDGENEVIDSAINTVYDEVVAQYDLYLEFKDIVEKYDADAYTMQIGQSNNFIAAVSIEDFNKICDLHNELYSFQNNKRDMQYIEISLYLLPDSSIDFSKIKDKEIVENSIGSEYDTINGLELGDTERFASEVYSTVLESEEFVTEWANVESTWSIPSETYETSEGSEIYYMNRKYEDYKYIIILDSLEPNQYEVVMEAWGIY